jgi:4-diphosphocytidyl-2-C-methyl-D-erythritol kinase
VTPLQPGTPLWLVLACPPAGLSTAAVFRDLTVPAEPVDGSAIQASVRRGDVEETGRRLFNRLQPVAERLCPSVAEIARLLAECGPAGSLMSGSGTTLFALCRDSHEARRIASQVQNAREKPVSRAYVVRSCF